MTSPRDETVPDADAFEQERPAGYEPDESPPRIPDEAPEADVVEQAADVSVVGKRRRERDPEVPDADAWEQEQDVRGAEEDDEI